MILWVSCGCKRIPRNLRANWNTAVQRSEAGTKNFSRKEEVEREWYTLDNLALTPWLQHDWRSGDSTLHCFNSLPRSGEAVELKRL